MVTAHSTGDLIKLEVITNERFQELKNADEIIDAIKHYRYLIKERLDFLEEQEQTDEIDREIGALIFQDLYLSALLGKQKYEIAEIFFANQAESKCVLPDVLQWYQG